MTDNHADLHRAFIAVPLPEELQQRIYQLQKQLKGAVPELKPAAVHNLHLTLHFLGDRTQEQLADVGRNMVSMGKKKEIFNVTLKNLGFFPHQRKPRVIWLGLEPADKLIELHAELADRLERLGLLDERCPYRPHLTIGRFKTTPKDAAQLCPFLSQECGSLCIDSLALYSSRLTPSGAVHTPLQQVKLGKAD